MKKIKNKTELLNAKLREFKIKEQALKDCVPLEMHNKVKKQLQDLLKRHQDFRNVLVQPNSNGLVIPKSQPTFNLVQGPAPVFNDLMSPVIQQEFSKDMFPVKYFILKFRI